VPGDDLPLIIDENGVTEAKPLDALGDLADLLFGVCSCIALIWPERFDREGLDLHYHPLFEASVLDARCEFKHRDPAPEAHGSAFAQSEDCAWCLAGIDNGPQTWISQDSVATGVPPVLAVRSPHLVNGREVSVLDLP
jgi:hypothetical protein